MRLPNGTIITHAGRPYDPIKAHEYYMRTRVLKGRKKATTYTVKYASGKTVKLSAKQLSEQKAYAAERVTAILKKLDELNAKLSKAMAVARDKKVKSTRAAREASKPPSAAEKSEAARESKQYREKHKQKLATQRKRTAATSTTEQKSEKTDPVKELETKINKIRVTLKAVIARQRALSGATQNR